MPSCFLELSPVISPAVFFPRPSSLSSQLMGGLLAVCTEQYLRNRPQKRQIRTTFRPSGSDETTLRPRRAPCQVGPETAATIAAGVAKKSRTPAPPRKIQAPQRRVEPRRHRTPEQRRTLWITAAFAASGIVALVAVLLAFKFTNNSSNASTASATTPDTANLIGVQTGPAQWNAGLDHLTDRLKPLGLSELGAEGTVIHIHQHLDIFVDGKHITVPQSIGIFDGQYL